MSPFLSSKIKVEDTSVLGQYCRWPIWKNFTPLCMTFMKEIFCMQDIRRHLRRYIGKITPKNSKCGREVATCPTCQLLRPQTSSAITSGLLCRLQVSIYACSYRKCRKCSNNNDYIVYMH